MLQLTSATEKLVDGRLRKVYATWKDGQGFVKEGQQGECPAPQRPALAPPNFAARPVSAGTTVLARRRKRSISKVAFLKRKAKAAAGAAAAASSPIATTSPKKKSSSAMSRQARLNFEPPKKRSSASKHLYMLMTVQVRSDFVFASLLLLQHTRLPNLFIYHFSF